MTAKIFMWLLLRALRQVSRCELEYSGDSRMRLKSPCVVPRMEALQFLYCVAIRRELLKAAAKRVHRLLKFANCKTPRNMRPKSSMRASGQRNGESHSRL